MVFKAARKNSVDISTLTGIQRSRGMVQIILKKKDKKKKIHKSLRLTEL